MSLLYFILYLFIFMHDLCNSHNYICIQIFFFFAGSLCFYDHFRNSLIFPFVLIFLSWLLSKAVFLQDIHTLFFSPHAIFSNIAIFSPLYQNMFISVFILLQLTCSPSFPVLTFRFTQHSSSENLFFLI